MCARDAGAFTIVIKGLETLLDEELLDEPGTFQSGNKKLGRKHAKMLTTCVSSWWDNR